MAAQSFLTVSQYRDGTWGRAMNFFDMLPFGSRTAVK